MVYAPFGGRIRLDLTGVKRSLSVARMNPRDGTCRALDPVSEGSGRTFSTPIPEDWVLHLKRA